MARDRSTYRCQECGLAAPKPGSLAATRPQPIGEIRVEAGGQRTSSGMAELDRVLGGGVVTGSLVLIGGDPGIGKSTLLLQVSRQLAERAGPVLYVSGEESAAQVKLRADRLGSAPAGLYFVAETDLLAVEAHVTALQPRFLIVDSIQTVYLPGLESAPGSVSQVRECGARLMALAKGRGIATFLVGHVTKEGAIAGPRVLEHLVDAVLTFEGDRGQSLRTLRSAKNRFGGTAELGVFEMKARGLVEVADASRLFLADRHVGVPGSAVGCLLEGRRAVALEIQSLVAPNDGPHPRRVAHGLERERLEVLAAVLQQRARIDLSKSDVFVRVAGGFRADEPAVDLALALALASSVTGAPVPPDLVAIGEVGLAGDVRAVPGIGTRLGECARLGFRRAVVGRSVSVPDGLKVHAVAELGDALGLLVRA